jgi:uncharacterized spore protein YtfJ
MAEAQMSAIVDRLGAVQDALEVRKVFGEAYVLDGVTIIPVATVQGGGGGGGGEGTGPGADGSGSGSGLGFGVKVRPIGVYEVRDGVVTWRPAVDVMRVILGGQFLGLVALLLLGRWLRRRG